MTVYAVLLIWVILCSRLENTKLTWGQNTIVSNKIFYLLTTFIPIWAVMAFRGITVGTDTFANASYFVSAATASSLSYIIDDGVWKAGIDVISYGIGFFFTGPEAYIVWSSTVIAVGFATFIYRTSNKVWMSVFLFLTLNLFFISLNASRQFIAISIALNAFVCLYHNMTSRIGWGLFILAAWIHASMFSFIPVVAGIWLAKRCRFYTKLYFISIGVAILFVISMMSVATLFSSLFPHYAIYTEGTGADNLIENTGGGKIIVLYLVLLLLLGILFVKKKLSKCNVKSTMMDACIPGAIFCVIIGIAFATNTMMNRIALPYQCLFLSLIPYILQLIEQKMRNVVMGIMMIGFIGYYYLWAQGNLGDIIPYYTWLSI